MNTPPATRQRQSGRANAGSQPRSWWRALLLAAMALLNLACMTITTSWKVVHQEGQEDRVSVTLSRHMTAAYLEAARSANAAREADYQAAGQDTADIFPDTMEEARQWLLADVEKLQNEGYQVVEDDRGFTAEADFTLAEFQATHDEEGTVRLQVDQDRPEGIAYIFEVDLPESTFDLEELDQLRQDWPLPKPSLDPVDTDQVEEGSIVGGITAIFDMTGLEVTELDTWYGQGIMVEAGLPVVEYAVELPGRITVHEVGGAEAGQVEGNRVTLVVGEAFWREFGPGEHRFRVESLLSVCEETCTEPHMIWDGVSEYPVCSCICEKGWEMMAEGCVDCQALCRQLDPPAEYDPENSEANRCACQSLPDRDGDGVPDERDACPDEPAATEDGCPQEGEAAPAAEDERSTPSTPGVERFPSGEGTKGPSAGQAAGAAATLSGLAYLWWLLDRLGAGGAEPEFAPVPPPLPTEPTAPPPTEQKPPLLPSADPQSLQLLQTRFQEMVDQRIGEGYFVMNRDGTRKSWNWTVGLLTNWAQGYTGGQCGEFAEWGAAWSRDFVEEIFGPGAIVDQVYIGERSTRYPDGFIDAADALYQATHAATRVILPTGESYILDYWEAAGERQSDPLGDLEHGVIFGGPRPRGEVRLIPEKEWVEKWTEAIGEDDAEVFNVNDAQEEFQRSLFVCDTFEEACERFLSIRPYLRGATDLQAQTVINNWRKSRWYR